MDNSYINPCFDLLQLFSLPLIVAEEVSILTGVNMFVDLQQEPFAELKCLNGELWINKSKKT